jgi:hypothetical protein
MTIGLFIDDESDDALYQECVQFYGTKT